MQGWPVESLFITTCEVQFKHLAAITHLTQRQTTRGQWHTLCIMADKKFWVTVKSGTSLSKRYLLFVQIKYVISL